MDLLKDEKGFSMIEALAGIALIGLLAALSASVLVSMYDNPKTLLRGEAMLLAEKEMNYCRSASPERDTLYTNETGNLEIHREVDPGRNVKRIIVSVTTINKIQTLVELNILLKK
jgi:prepilin-type N-terminal cleavage/methylation domain-containing protein